LKEASATASEDVNAWFYKDPYFEREFQSNSTKVMTDRPPLKVLGMNPQ
jgi:hypothetical protein